MPILRTVHSKIAVLIIIFLLLVLSSFIATYLTVQSHFGDEETIELVHNWIPIVQRLTWLALDSGSQAEINAVQVQYEQTQEAVRNAAIHLAQNSPVISADDIHGHIQALDAAWGTYLNALHSLSALSLQDASRQQAEQNLRAETLNVFARIDELSHATETYSNKRHELLLRIQMIFVVSTCLCIILGYLLIRLRVIKPLSLLTNAAQRIERGVLNESVEIVGEDEIAHLARSFDRMRIAVRTYQTDLETRIHERTSEMVAAFEFSQEIVSQRDINALVKSAIAKSRTLMRAKDASLCLVTPDGCSVELVSTTNDHADGKKLVQPVGDNIPDMVMSRGQTLTSQVSRFGCAFLWHTPEDQCLSASLHVGEHVIGAMCVTREKDQPFSEEESRAFSLLANSAAVAILNARYEEGARQQARDAAVLSERERLASELHDNLAQTLNLVNLKVSQLQDMQGEPISQVVQREVAAVRVNVENAIEQVRMFASEMAAAAQVHEDEFLGQLEESIEEFKTASSLPVELTGIEASFDRLSALARKQLLMIISESLTNIRRHAQAQRVAIRFYHDQNFLYTTIEDDGIGFQSDRHQGKHHLGLRIMRTRAERSGGSFNITSEPGKGTRVTVFFPIAEKESA